MPTDHDSIVEALRAVAEGDFEWAVDEAADWAALLIPAVESLVAENARLALAVTNAKLEFDAIWRAVQVGSGHDDADAANEAGRVAENASRMMARAIKGDD